MTTDFDEQAHGVFMDRLGTLEAPTPDPATDDPLADGEYLATLTPEQLEAIQLDGFNTESLRPTYAAWRASREATDEEADPEQDLELGMSPIVSAYESPAAVGFAELRPEEQEAVIERSLDRRLGQRTAAMRAFERNEIGEADLPVAERTASIQRAFERRGAIERARRGGRP